VSEERDRLYGIRCKDGGVIPCETQTERDRLWSHMQKASGKGGCRIPTARLGRSAPGGEWTPEDAVSLGPAD
jgi:hypothetical protein